MGFNYLSRMNSNLKLKVINLNSDGLVWRHIPNNKLGLTTRSFVGLNGPKEIRLRVMLGKDEENDFVDKLIISKI